MYTGTYYDGRSSRGRAASVQVLPDLMYITYTDDDQNPIKHVWQVANIHQGHFVNNTSITLRYGDYPMESLTVNEPDFFESLKSANPHKRFNASDFEFLRSKGLKGATIIAVAFIALVVVSYFYILPPVAEFWAARIPMSMEEKLGDKMYDNVMQGYSIDQRLTREANEYWRAMHVSSPYTVNITVVHEPVANAFALPGGQIIVFDQIIKDMKDYDELAGLLAHEYSHVKLRHSVRMLSRNLAGYLFVSILLNDASGTLAVIATNANSLKELNFSRQMEHNADEGGYDLMQQARISPEGMLKLFHTLKNTHEEGISIPQFISTHPLTDERISYISDRLKKDKSPYYEHEDLKKIWEEMKSED